MKILILTEGGKNTGFGHLTRSTALYQAFKAEGDNPELIVNGDSSILSLLKGKQYQIINWLKKETKLMMLIKNNDFIIIDSYLAGKGLYRKVSKTMEDRLLIIDDCNRLEYPKSIVVNPSIYGDKVNYPKNEEVTYLLGKDYIILRKEFWKVPKKTIRKQVKNILITFGGADHGNLIADMANHVRNRFGLNVHTIESRKSKVSAKGIFDLMQKADICISGGGQTIYELARLGVPTIGICFAKNQEMNLKEWRKRVFINYIKGPKNKRLLPEVVNCIDKLMPHKKRLEYNKRIKSCVDGEGASRIVSLLKSNTYIFKARSAKREDCRDLWLWRNYDEVRKGCFTNKPIVYENHKEWFNRKLKEEKAKIYIVENQEKKKLGQVRFEAAGPGDAYINVNLNPKFFGKRLGSRIIKFSSNFFMQASPDIKRIIAQVLIGNAASHKAFQRAGYKLCSQGLSKNGKKMDVYDLKGIKA